MIQEFFGKSLSQHVKRSKSCTITNEGYILKPQNSNVLVDFSSLGDVESCFVTLKRISGNGILNINGKKYQVMSKRGQKIKLECRKLEIDRGSGTIGEVMLNSVGVGFSKSVSSLSEVKEKLKRCGILSGITYSGDKIIATEGATIANGLAVAEIKTTPPNVAQMADTIVFKRKCEILDIVTTTEFQYSTKESIDVIKNKIIQESVKKSNSNFVERKEIQVKEAFPPPVKIEKQKVKMPTKSTRSNGKKKRGKIKNVKEAQNNISPTAKRLKNALLKEGSLKFIFKLESLNINNFASKSGVTQSGTSVIINRSGLFEIPINSIQSGCEYLLTINSKKVGGNGKAIASLVVNNREVSSASFNAQSSESNVQINLKAKGISTVFDKVFIRIRRDRISYGDVVVNSICLNLIDDTSIEVNNVVQPLDTGLNNLDYKPVFFTNSSYENWYNLVNSGLMKNKPVNDISFCTVGQPAKNERVFVEPFDVTSVTEAQVFENYKLVKKIITPSLPNFMLFKNVFEKRSITITMNQLLYPVAFGLGAARKENDSVLVVCDKSGVNIPKDYTLVKREDLIKEEDVLSYIREFGFVIDISESDHHISSLIEVAKLAGVKIMTNNIRYVMDNSVLVINDKGMSNLNLETEVEKLKEKPIKEVGKNDHKKYNQAYIDCVKEVLGK